MPPVEHTKISISNFEFPPVDYPTAGIANSYADFKTTADGYVAPFAGAWIET